MSSKKWTFLVDCNSFFVSCEQLFNPSLLGKPVVVLSSNDGCVIARSKEAKKLGIPMGAPAYQYALLFRSKNVLSFSANFTLYSDLSRRVMDVLSQFSPDLEQYSIDEAFLQIQCPDPLKEASEMKRRVQKWTGIPVAVGIGRTKTLAKLASDLAKNKGGIHLLENCDEELATLDVQEIWGIGSRLAEQLKKLGICTAFDFKKCEPSWIKKRFSVVVERTLLELQGHNCLPLEEVEEPNQSILRSRSFKEAIEPFDELRSHLANHVASAATKLRSQGSLCSALTVFASTSLHQKESYSNAATFELSEPSDYTPALLSHAGRCFEKIYRPGYQFKKLGVLLSGLVDKDLTQDDLFGESPEKKAKKARAMELIDQASLRFGKGAIRLAAQAEQPSCKRPKYTTSWDELPLIKI